jgi:hypothetical protein
MRSNLSLTISMVLEQIDKWVSSRKDRGRSGREEGGAGRPVTSWRRWGGCGCALARVEGRESYRRWGSVWKGSLAKQEDER